MADSSSSICSFNILAHAIFFDFVLNLVDLGFQEFEGFRLNLKLKGVVPVYMWISLLYE